ncbi:MAG: hypothetical protein GEU90_09165 [Gemmatimonas sp.]|nr:hypothetical protein [Gemmatimonas sp.]
MTEIRLLFAALPKMLSEILREAASGDPELRIVEEMTSLEGIAEVAARARPDILVVGSDGSSLPKACVRLMYDLPLAGALAVSRDGRPVSAYRLRPQVSAMENASTREIVAAIHELSLPPPELRD